MGFSFNASLEPQLRARRRARKAEDAPARNAFWTGRAGPTPTVNPCVGWWLPRPPWVQGLTEGSKRASSLLFSYQQAIDHESWPLFWVWALPHSKLSARSDTPNRCEIIITSHYTLPCTPPELVSGYFCHLMCAEASTKSPPNQTKRNHRPIRSAPRRKPNQTIQQPWQPTYHLKCTVLKASCGHCKVFPPMYKPMFFPHQPTCEPRSSANLEYSASDHME